MLAKAGRKTTFIGKVGHDIFGRRLKSVLKEAGIDTLGLAMDENVRATLAFVETMLGKCGSCVYYRDLRMEAAPFLQENTIETTGAGDTFGGCQRLR